MRGCQPPRSSLFSSLHTQGPSQRPPLGPSLVGPPWPANRLGLRAEYAKQPRAVNEGFGVPSGYLLVLRAPGRSEEGLRASYLLSEAGKGVPPYRLPQIAMHQARGLSLGTPILIAWVWLRRTPRIGRMQLGIACSPHNPHSRGTSHKPLGDWRAPVLLYRGPPSCSQSPGPIWVPAALTRE